MVEKQNIKIPEHMIYAVKDVAKEKLKADQDGMSSSKIAVVWSTCDNIVRFGNLSLIANTNSDNVMSNA